MLPKTPTALVSEFERETNAFYVAGEIGTTSPIAHEREWFKSALTSLLLEAKVKIRTSGGGTFRDNVDLPEKREWMDGYREALSEAHAVIDALVEEVKQS